MVDELGPSMMPYNAYIQRIDRISSRISWVEPNCFLRHVVFKTWRTDELIIRPTKMMRILPVLPTSDQLRWGSKPIWIFILQKYLSSSFHRTYAWRELGCIIRDCLGMPNNYATSWLIKWYKYRNLDKGKKNSPNHRRKWKFGGIAKLICMSKVRIFFEIAPNIAFPELNFYELYYSTFEKNELGRIEQRARLADAWHWNLQ